MNNESFIDGDPGVPHAFIQWKGTAVCADIHCTCGEHFHIDDEFMYFVCCPKCKTIFEVGCHVALRPATAERLRGVSKYAIKSTEELPDQELERVLEEALKK